MANERKQELIASAHKIIANGRCTGISCSRCCVYVDTSKSRDCAGVLGVNELSTPAEIKAKLLQYTYAFIRKYVTVQLEFEFEVQS
jgi:hypothetical protein